MTKKTRGEQKFAAITYTLLAEWTGLERSTVAAYGSKGLIPKHDLEKTLIWVNERRAEKGLAPIGQAQALGVSPSEAGQDSDDTN